MASRNSDDTPTRGPSRDCTSPPSFGAQFFASIALFLLGSLGLVVSSFPYLVPPALTIWDTAAHPSSQLFMLAGTLILLPLILGYTALSYWLFRGKVAEGKAFH